LHFTACSYVYLQTATIKCTSEKKAKSKLVKFRGFRQIISESVYSTVLIIVVIIIHLDQASSLRLATVDSWTWLQFSVSSWWASVWWCHNARCRWAGWERCCSKLPAVVDFQRCCPNCAMRLGPP